MKRSTKIPTWLLALLWGIQTAWRINKKTFIFWLFIGLITALMPVASLHFNQKLIAYVANFVQTGQGDFVYIFPTIISLCITLLVISLSKRINGDFFYTMLYDSYYLGMQELLMDTMRKMDLTFLFNKDNRDEYRAVIARAGSLTDIMSSLLMLIIQLISTVSILIFAITISPLIACIAFVYLVVVIIINLRLVTVIRNTTLSSRDADRRFGYYSNQPMTPGVAKETRLFSSKSELMKQWEIYFNISNKFENKRSFYTELGTFISGVVFFIFMVCMILYAITLLDSHFVDASIILTLYTLGQNLSDIIPNLTRSLLNADHGLFALTRQYRFLKHVKTEATPSDFGSKETYPKHYSSTIIEAKDVSFSYNGAKTVLDTINFKIYKGEIVALIGVNGSGKSTLAKLLLSLFEPTSGTLLYNDLPFHQYPKNYLRSKIGAFFQDFSLVHTSLKENIGLGNLSQLDNPLMVTKAMIDANAQRVLGKLPRGLDTLLLRNVYKDGVELSGGEKQKIALSRTYIGSQEVLILDEPASALDPLAEIDQFKSIMTRVGSQTAVLISHRVGFARLADRIIVLDKGKIVGNGTHDELIKDNVVYKDLYEKQAKWYQQ